MHIHACVNVDGCVFINGCICKWCVYINGWVCVYVWLVCVCTCICLNGCVWLCVCSATNEQSKWENREYFHVLNIIETVCLKQDLSVRLARLVSTHKPIPPCGSIFRCQRSTGLRRERAQDSFCWPQSPSAAGPCPFQQGLFFLTLRNWLSSLFQRGPAEGIRDRTFLGVCFVFDFTLRTKASWAFKMWKTRV